MRYYDKVMVSICAVQFLMSALNWWLTIAYHNPISFGAAIFCTILTIRSVYMTVTDAREERTFQERMKHYDFDRYPR